jgi:hypothetical protein
LRQEVVNVVAATAAAATVSEVPPAPVPTAVDQAAVVEIPDDDAPPPGWGQWESWPAPAPEPAVGVLVMREDGCVMPRHPLRSVEASSSRVALPAPDGAAARREQERDRASTPPTHFSEAQVEQALCQEFRDHGASLNNTLNEVLRIHVDPAWPVFQVRIFLLGFGVFSLTSSSCLFRTCASSDQPPPCLVCW